MGLKRVREAENQPMSTPDPVRVVAQDSLLSSPRETVKSELQVKQGWFTRRQAVTTADTRDQVRAPRIGLGPKRGLSREESAGYIGVSPSKFDQLRKDKRIGPPRLIDGRKVWDIRELDRDFEAFPIEGDEQDEDWSTSV